MDLTIFRARDGSKFLVCLAGHFTAFGSCLVHFRPERGAADRDVPDGNDQFSVQGHLSVELLHKHLAVVQGSLAFVGALGAAAPALPVPALQRGLADLEDRGAGGPAGALFAPIRCRTHAYTSTKPKPLVQCAPARAARSSPASRRRAAGAGTRGAALTGLGLAARVGNLQPEGESGKRWLCRAASLPLAARKGLGEVQLSGAAGPVPGAGRWRGLAPLSARHGSQGWARRNTPPGGSEFPFRCTVFKSLRCQVEGGRGWGCSGESVALASGVFPRRRRSPPSPASRPGRAGCPRGRQLVLIRCLDPSSPRGSPV